MYSLVISAAIWGVQACMIRVEADVSSGLPGFAVVGYVSVQVREAQERVRAALRNVGILMPPKRITINLAPADLRKEGGGFDLPMAASILLAVGRIPHDSLEGVLVLGELGLDGSVRPVNGVLPAVCAARSAGCHTCLVPMQNLDEGRAAGQIQVIGLGHLEELIAFTCSRTIPDQPTRTANREREEQVDFRDIRGQETVKKAALLAAAGFHNLLLLGPPGCGKSMAAHRLTTILPPLEEEERLEIMKIHSIAGLLREGTQPESGRPFRAPHHTVSPQALAGGGRIPRPGEISLAHHGVLFLDELAEVPRSSLEVLRQPLEEHRITISRLSGSCDFPADFLFVAAMNPCPCGCFPDLNRCSCTDAEIARYRGRVSRALLERIDLCVDVEPLAFEDLEERAGKEAGKDSASMRARVLEAVNIQRERYRGTDIAYNSRLDAGQVQRYCPLSAEAGRLLERVFRSMQLSARAYYRMIRTARTAADLAGSSLIREEHIHEAVCFRSPEPR